MAPTLTQIRETARVFVEDFGSAEPEIGWMSQAYEIDSRGEQDEDGFTAYEAALRAEILSAQADR